jgi:hypothetical protein
MFYLLGAGISTLIAIYGFFLADPKNQKREKHTRGEFVEISPIHFPEYFLV